MRKLSSRLKKVPLFILNKEEKKKKNFFGKNSDKIIGISALIVAIVATCFSARSYISSNRQFELSISHSDSLFQVQLLNSRDLNDSLIGTIEVLQQVTDEQLSEIRNLAEFTEKMRLDQLYAERPIISLSKSFLRIDTSQIDSVIIETVYRNVGKRTAYRIYARGFVLSNKFFPVSASSKSDRYRAHRDKDQVGMFFFSTSLNGASIKDFYYCYDIEYTDVVLSKVFRHPVYYHYHLVNGVYDFETCNENETLKLKDIITEFCELTQEPLMHIGPTESGLK